MEDCRFRGASPGDADDAVPLIYSSGPEAFDCVFGRGRRRATAFLHRCFTGGRSLFGYRNHRVAELGGRVVGVGAFYDARDNRRMTPFTVARIVRDYGPACPAVLLRGLRMERLIRPPERGMLYVGHLGVAPDFRGQGICARMLEREAQRARASGYASMVLDVAVTNPRAERLYERLGFRTVAERRSPFSGVPDHRRMVRRP